MEHRSGFPEVGELLACSGLVVEEGAHMILLTNEVETSKYLELSESKKNVLVTNINIVKYSATLSAASFYNSFHANVFENIN